MRVEKDNFDQDIEILEAALGEYNKYGRVVTVRCHSCGELIEIYPLGEAALSVKCSCGKFNDTLRGI